MLTLGAAMDLPIVNMGDDAPTSIHELVQRAGGAIEPSSAPLTSPGARIWTARLVAASAFSPSRGASTSPRAKG